MQERLTAVVVSHDNDTLLRNILGNLRYQTRPPDEVLALVSFPWDLMRLREDFPNVSFVVRPNYEDWGHDKRSTGLQMAMGDWVGFFNHDDSYDMHYVEKMLQASDKETDVVYCNWNDVPRCRFKFGFSTAGNFLVRTNLAKQVGWNGRVFESDGLFIDALVSAGARTKRVDEILYHHNVQ